MHSKPSRSNVTSHHRNSASVRMTTARSLKKAQKFVVASHHAERAILQWHDKNGRHRVTPRQILPSIMKQRLRKKGERPQVASTKSEPDTDADADETTDVEDTIKKTLAPRNPRALRRVTSALAEALEKQHEGDRRGGQGNNQTAIANILDTTANEPAVTPLDPVFWVNIQPQNQESDDFASNFISFMRKPAPENQATHPAPSVHNLAPLDPPPQNATDTLADSRLLESCEHIGNAHITEKQESIMMPGLPALDFKEKTTDTPEPQDCSMVPDTLISPTSNPMTAVGYIPLPSNHSSEHIQEPPTSSFQESVRPPFYDEHIHSNPWNGTAHSQDGHGDLLNVIVDTHDKMDVDNNIIGDQQSSTEDFVMLDLPDSDDTFGFYGPITASQSHFSTPAMQPQSFSLHEQSNLPLIHSGVVGYSVFQTVPKALTDMPFVSSLASQEPVSFSSAVSKSLGNEQSHPDGLQKLGTSAPLPLSSVFHLPDAPPSTIHQPPHTSSKYTAVAPVQSAWWASFKSIEFDNKSALYSLPVPYKSTPAYLGRAAIHISPAPTRLRMTRDIPHFPKEEPKEECIETMDDLFDADDSDDSLPFCAEELEPELSLLQHLLNGISEVLRVGQRALGPRITYDVPRFPNEEPKEECIETMDDPFGADDSDDALLFGVEELEPELSSPQLLLNGISEILRVGRGAFTLLTDRMLDSIR